MKNINYLVFLCLFLLIPFACKKDKQEKTVPVEYFLSAADKNLFNGFSNHMSVSYSDENSNSIYFQADSIYSKTTCLEYELDKGEAFSVTYKCSAYYPNYSYYCRLSKSPDGSVDLRTIFSTGTFANDRYNDYVVSGFMFNPGEPTDLDTLNYFGSTIQQSYLDSITLRNKTFYNVFYGSRSLINTDPKQTISLYYTNESGVIAFENNDGRLWVRN